MKYLFLVKNMVNLSLVTNRCLGKMVLQILGVTEEGRKLVAVHIGEKTGKQRHVQLQ